MAVRKLWGGFREQEGHARPRSQGRAGTGKGTWRQDRRRTGETGLADQLPEKTGKAGSEARE